MTIQREGIEPAGPSVGAPSTQSPAAGDAATSMTLVQVLGILAPAAAATSEVRQGAARVLHQQLRRLGPSLLTRVFRHEYTSYGDFGDAVHDAIQRTLIVASTTPSPYRGDTASGARAWCSKVLIRECRRALGSANQARDFDPDQFAAVPTWHETTTSDVQALLDALQPELWQAHKGRTPAVRLALLCHIERTVGLPVEGQALRYLRSAGAKGPLGREDLRRAARAVYKWRYWGRLRGRRAVRRLQCKGLLLPQLERAARALDLLD